MRGAALACLALAALICCGPAAAGEWRTYAGGPRRLFFNPAETTITPANVGLLRIKWQFPTNAVVTASPSVAVLDLPGEGPTQVAFVQSWDHHLYAIRTRDGTELWRFFMEDQPGATFPNAGSADVRAVDGAERVFIAGGQTVYSVDARTGQEVWRFQAGTGCGNGNPPGLCGFMGERNTVESSPIVAENLVLFGMEVNDQELGKGGFYAVDVRDGRLAWYFDVETGATCRPLPGDDVRRFDGYHTAAELGLPSDFFATRPGCDFTRTVTGCGNVWSSASIDAERQRLFFTVSNCDTDNDPGTAIPPPPMPPYDEGFVALGFDGTPAWRWRPREVDNADLAFGSVPNLFTIEVAGEARDVVGGGSKDGTYYVLDREGVNAASGVRWDDADPSALPYWRTQVVPGGEIGGVISTAAVDEAAGRVYFSTAPGLDTFMPQRPTVHALALQSGAIVWQNTAEPNADASFAPTSAIPGVVFVGKVTGGSLRAYDAANGALLGSVPISFSLSSAPAIVDGLVLIGGGTGARSFDRFEDGDVAARIPSRVTALCAPGTPACDGDGDGFDFPDECDDRDPTVHPGAVESCNGKDDDCDGAAPDEQDADGDGFRVCAGDCNDTDATVSPNARDVPDDGRDRNCDGLVAKRRDRCGRGGSAPGDAADLAALGEVIAARCPCPARRGRRGYVACARRVMGETIAAGALRGKCRQSARSAARASACGRALP